ncbi:MAG: hypothetical protein IKM59_06470 [Oscillospiraceae bacterium]|nr:hypothetical protein [Oscillospiraceae bacterium]
MKKRMLALVLTLAMLLSMVPGTVFAAETETEHTEHNFVEVQPETEAPVTEPDSSTEPTEAEKAPVKSPQTIDSVQDLLAAIDYEAAVADLEYLTRTIGTRPAGSIGEHMAAEYVRNVFDELGYDSSVQEVPIVKNSYWPGTIGEIYLGDLTLSGFGPISNANYTGFGHAEGTAVYLSDPANVASLGSDLSGKVVFFPGNWRSGKSYNANTLSCIQALDAANAEGIVVLMDHTIDPA